MDIRRLEEASYAYYNGTPTMTDEEFDFAVIKLRKNDPNNAFLKRIGAPVPGTNKVQHNIPMGSLDNANNYQELEAWVESVFPEKCDICMTHKLDGASIELKYEKGRFVQAITRGDGEFGEDVTRNVLKSGNIPLTIDTGISSVRCECLIHKCDWQTHFKGDANPRNSVAGTLRRHDGKNAKYLQFYAFDAIIEPKASQGNRFDSDYTILDCLARWFNIPKYIVAKYDYIGGSRIHQIKSWCDTEYSRRDNLQYEIDGIVLKMDDRVKSAKLGSKNGRPKGQVAYKFKPRGGETVLLDVTWQVGQTGALTPVGKVAPVGVGGTVIRSALLCNVDEIDRLQIAIGDIVEIIRAGDVIPKVSQKIRNGQKRRPIVCPDKCPECGFDVYPDGAKMVCENTTCSGKSLGRIMTWIRKRNILNLGQGAIVGANIKSLVGLYKTTEDEWASAKMKNGVLGTKRAAKIIDSLEQSKRVSISDFIGSICIKGIGRSLASVLCNNLNIVKLDDLFDLTPEDIVKLNGIGDVRSRAFCEWLAENKDEVLELASYMSISDNCDSKITNVFDGETICFTGKSPHPRSKMSAIAETCGAEVCSSISSKTTILVIADPDSMSSKAVKARDMGLKLMSPEKFLDIAGDG